MLQKNVIYITGLPRSGSTLLCQILGTHPQIDSPIHSSPLCQTLNQLRHNLSDNEFFLAQLDVDFDLTYQRLLQAIRGFMNGWLATTNKPWVVDKNRGWLMQLDTLHLIDPQAKLLVCIRELGQIYGSIETQHQKTLLIDFPDHLAILSRYTRADKLFGAEGVIGGPLKAIEAVQDMPNALQQRLFYVIYEDFMHQPHKVMEKIYHWLNLPNTSFNSQQLPIKAHESDSYYRFKYPHKTRERLQIPPRHEIPSRIERELQTNFAWFYKTFYPGLIEK